MKGKSNPLVWILALVVVALALGWVSIPQTPYSVVPTGQQTIGQQVTSALTCQDDGSNTLDIATLNSLVTHTLYSNGNIAVVGADGTIVATDTTSGGTSLTYSATDIPCAPNAVKGSVYVYAGTTVPLSGNALNSVKASYDVSSISAQKIIPVSNVSSLYLRMYDSANQNLSAGSQNTTTENDATAMGTGSVKSGKIQLYVTNSSSQYGSDDGGLIWAIDNGNSAAFSANSISLSSNYFALTPITCPTRVSAIDAADRCYHSRALKSSDGVMYVDYIATSDIGNPTADITIYIEDPQYILEGGRIVQDSFDASNTNVGGIQQTAIVNIS
jgi:hypothetical protein